MVNIVSFSGGKDSAAMLLRMLELDYKIDKIVFADTGFEFPELYDYIKKIEKHIGKEITILKPEKDLFKKWFYGKVTRGNNKDKVRGFPLMAFPCWWSREAKIKPLSRIQKEADNVYIGIAYDESHRMSNTDGNLRYPLVEWKWTEQDCVDYLNKKGLFNPLYVNFNRLGCWFCQKQSKSSLYVLFKNYPELWERMKWWDKESKKVSGHYIKGNYPLTYIEEDFKKGKIPNKLPKYQCWKGCESVKKAFQKRQCRLGEFIELENKPEVNSCLPLEEKQEGGNGIPPTSKEVGILPKVL
jgi:3'-phosphoadenosine 5'-phosphosulfate sulfotransferase (PAPS reductase)/FAD synthetase